MTKLDYSRSQEYSDDIVDFEPEFKPIHRTFDDEKITVKSKDKDLIAQVRTEQEPNQEQVITADVIKELQRLDDVEDEEESVYDFDDETYIEDDSEFNYDDSDDDVDDLLVDLETIKAPAADAERLDIKNRVEIVKKQGASSKKLKTLNERLAEIHNEQLAVEEKADIPHRDLGFDDFEL